MAILAAHNITSANVDTLIYTIPPDKVGTVQVNICNRNTAPADISLAVTTGGTPGNGNWLEFEHPLDPKCPLERAPQRLASGERIYVRSSRTNISVVVTGEIDTPIGG